MKFADFWEDKYSDLKSPFMTRLDGLPIKRLKKSSEKYKQLDKQKDKLYDDYDFICDLAENRIPEKQSYTTEDMKVLKEFFSIAREMDDYERLEIYKLGLHDCIALLEWINGK